VLINLVAYVHHWLMRTQTNLTGVTVLTLSSRYAAAFEAGMAAEPRPKLDFTIGPRPSRRRGRPRAMDDGEIEC
jgi:hypothetical protein